MGTTFCNDDTGVQISCEVLNVGATGAHAKVVVEVDNLIFDEWESDFLDPGQGQAAKMSFGRLAAGDHEVLVFVNPGSGAQDHDTNSFTVAALSDVLVIPEGEYRGRHRGVDPTGRTRPACIDHQACTCCATLQPASPGALASATIV